MTYCVGMLMDAGLVFLSDTRTNAGVDQINTFRKMTVFERRGQRVMVLLSAGNLAVTQAVVTLLHERMAGEGDSLLRAPNLFEAARHVGDCVREVHRRDADSLRAFGIDFNVSLIFGGQIAGEAPRLFNIYAAGNFVEATPDTPYFQIGESKYGKPIIDRIFRHHTPLQEAAKCALISMDSTLKSNLSVGMPLDLAILARDQLELTCLRRIEADDPYFQRLRTGWSERIQQAFNALPGLDEAGWCAGPSSGVLAASVGGSG
ncbi:MAG: proteasome-type protease [Tepidimonas sp.]|uniref:proteasome-type protease n=1 Tax=Tepidimonas sp. TaxID=2002775 RepID=UPI00298F1695|nr:proteasome-type protease [Tepidimonas sp.]MCS6810182.1 proteasome-type protease [Tepidimonas sp.]MDW8336846.1 proteasome-type protease [Tepidimonas sp.]